MKRSLVVCIVALVWPTLLLAQGAAQNSKSLIGTWKQNMEKSTYSPGPPPLKGSYSVRQYAAGDDGSIVAITKGRRVIRIIGFIICLVASAAGA